MKLITLENLKSFWKDVKSYVDNGLSKKADSVHGTHVTYGTINGKAPGTPSAGTSSKVAREDHVHPVQTTVSGNAGSATKLATARTINGTSFDGTANITTANWGATRTLTIGNTGKSVNGSGNVSWTLSEIGAAPSSHTHSYLPLSGGTVAGTLVLNTNTGSNPLRVTRGGGTAEKTDIYQDDFSLYINMTNDETAASMKFIMNATDTENGDGTGGFKNSTVTFSGSSSGSTVTANTFSGKLSGNASTATTLQTARTINGTSFNGSANITTANWGTARTLTIGNTGKSVNGSGNVSWSLSEIGALPLTGGTLSGRLTANGRISAPTAGSSWISGMTVTNATIGISTQQATGSYHPVLAVKTSGNHVANIGGIGDDFGFYGFKSGRTENATDWSFKINAGTGAVSSTGNITAPTFVGALSGNAATATKATQDSAGQQINKTYIKGLSVSGKTITYTKGDGTTGTITIQDSGSGTQSIGTATKAGLTKLYTGTGTATDGTMTQAAIKTALDGKASSSHTHSYLPLSGGTLTGKITFANQLGGGGLNSLINSNSLHSATGNGQMLTASDNQIFLGNPKTPLVVESSKHPIVNIGGSTYTMYHSGNFNPNDKADKSNFCAYWNWDDFNWRIHNHNGLSSITIAQGGDASGLYEWGAGLTFGGTMSSAQFYSPHQGNEMYWRSKWSNDSVRGWHRIWHSGNMAAPHWGTGAPSNSDGRPDGTVYYRYA